MHRSQSFLFYYSLFALVSLPACILTLAVTAEIDAPARTYVNIAVIALLGAHIPFWVYRVVPKWMHANYTRNGSTPSSILQRHPAEITPLPSFELKAMLVDLASPHKSTRRLAVQAIVDSGASPIASISCWPTQNCTELQLATAEAVLGEWARYVLVNQDDSEADIIEALYPDDCNSVAPKKRTTKTQSVERNRAYDVRVVEPTPRSFPEAESKPAAPPNRVVRALQQLSEKIKQTIMDWDVQIEPNVWADTEGKDCPLAPLDRRAFDERMRPIMADTWEHVADTLAAARTDFELIHAEHDIHAMLATLRWEAIATALDLRDPDGEALSADDVRQAAESLKPEEMPSAGSPHADWAKKYRRMRAIGL